MRRLFIILIVCILTLLPETLAGAAPKTDQPGGPSGVTVACGISNVGYMVYSMAITQPETLTLTFQATGSGLITFVVNNYQTSYSARTTGACGNCTLTIPNVQPGPYQTMQLSATVAADACPSGGLTASNFVLQISPASVAH